MNITDVPVGCGSSSKSGLAAGPFIQTSSPTVSSQRRITAASGSVAGCGRNVSPADGTSGKFNWHLLFRSHCGAATKSDFHCVCERDWEAVMFTLKPDLVSIFNAVATSDWIIALCFRRIK